MRDQSPQPPIDQKSSKRQDRLVKAIATGIGTGLGFLLFPNGTLLGVIIGAFVGDYVSNDLVDRYYDCRTRLRARGKMPLVEVLLECMGLGPTDPEFEKRLEQAKRNAERMFPPLPLPILLLASGLGAVSAALLISFVFNSLIRPQLQDAELMAALLLAGLLTGAAIGTIRSASYRRRLQVRINIDFLMRT